MKSICLFPDPVEMELESKFLLYMLADYFLKTLARKKVSTCSKNAANILRTGKIPYGTALAFWREVNDFYRPLKH